MCDVVLKTNLTNYFARPLPHRPAHQPLAAGGVSLAHAGHRRSLPDHGRLRPEIHEEQTANRAEVADDGV